MFLVLDFAVSLEVLLNGPEYVKRGDIIVLNCSADGVPIGGTAEYLVNDETFTSLRKHEAGCYSAILRSECPPDICWCSANGQVYILSINSSTYNNEVNITCLMKSSTQRKTDDLTVEIIDMIGPDITYSKHPLIPGTSVDFVCTIWTQMDKIEISWQCLNYTESSAERNDSKTYTSYLTIIVHSEHQGHNCTCVVKRKLFVAVKTIQIEVSYSLIIELHDTLPCNDTVGAQLVCGASGDMQVWGFESWIHSFQASFVRHINGTVYSNKSILSLPCSYQDVGEYRCTAWNNYSGVIYWANKSIHVAPKGPPVIISTHTVTQPKTILTVRIYSPSNLLSVEWFQENDLLTNSSMFRIITDMERIHFKIYNQTINTLGYVATLTLDGNVPGRYKVVLLNDFGKITEQFILRSTALVFNFRTVLWALTGIVIFIITVVMTTMVLRRHGFQSAVINGAISNTAATRAIYYAAPQVEVAHNPYDVIGSAYLDIMEYQSRRIYMEISDSHKDTDKDSDNSDKSSCHYMEIPD